MSGTSWGYFVPYQMDVQKALDELRQEVFDRGDYEPIDLYDVFDGFNDIDSMGFTTTSDELERESLMTQYGVEALRVLIDRVGISGLRAELRALAEAPKLSSLAELDALRCLSTDGTHSFLDIDRVGPSPGSGILAPLPLEELSALFGMQEPTHKAVKKAEAQGKIDTGRRWQAVYIVVYKDGKPDELFISGSSGD